MQHEGLDMAAFADALVGIVSAEMIAQIRTNDATSAAGTTASNLTAGAAFSSVEAIPQASSLTQSLVDKLGSKEARDSI